MPRLPEGDPVNAESAGSCSVITSGKGLGGREGVVKDLRVLFYIIVHCSMFNIIPLLKLKSPEVVRFLGAEPA